MSQLAVARGTSVIMADMRPSSSLHRISIPVLVGLFVSMAAIRSRACPVCLPFPRQSLADHLINSDAVVFARESADHPFTYQAMEWVKDPASPVAGEIEELFLNSSVRRKLMAEPTDAAVLVHSPDGRGWRMVAVADERLQEIVRRILLVSSQWIGSEGQTRRCEFFVPFFGDENRAIFELAYLELGRASYATIKDLAIFHSSERMEDVMNRREYLEWRSLAILLLAQDPQSREVIERGFRGCEEFGLTSHLSAWATALIEQRGKEAISQIEEMYFRDPQRTPEEVRQTLLALSVHGNGGHVHLRERIGKAYGSLLDNHPEFAGKVALDLTAWSDGRYREDIQDLIATQNDFEKWAILAMRAYVDSQ
ncbi:MAG: hypothetical protein ACR2NZ_07785 [Rubripirellula sp.]